ncbi:MAG: hypothetical protein AAF514_01410, partial [Verrucomicrobiota bacterium]
WEISEGDAPFPNGSSFNWELGMPSVVGPPAAASGEQVFGIGLSSDYENLSNLILRSPVIDLTNVERAKMTIQQFLDTSDTEGGQVNVLDENGEVLYQGDSLTGLTDGWEEFSLNLTKLPNGEAGVGRKIRLEFRFLSDDVGGDNGAGWYIDDLQIQ